MKQQFRKNGYSLTEQLVNSLEFGAPQDRDRIILIGFRQDIAEQLNLHTENGCLVGFPWETHKRYRLNDVKEINWPDRSPYNEGIETEAPQGIIEDLTVEHWWRRNDVIHHPNEDMFFSLVRGLFVSEQKTKEMLRESATNVYIVGVILQQLRMAIMRYTYIHIFLAAYLLQKRWQFSHYRLISSYLMM